MAGAGGTQIIGGKSYAMYSPEWYQAMDENKIHNAGVGGTAQGTGAGNAATTYLNALKTSGYPLLGSASSLGGGGSYGDIQATNPHIPAPADVPRIGPALTPDQIGHIQGPDMTAANAAEFARAKDQVGQTARGALTGLAGAMAGRGVLGSGVEGRGIGNVINKGQGELGDVSRQQAINNAALQEQNALASYQGDITQRGQNISHMDTTRGQDVTQRGQDVSSHDSAFNTLTNQRGQDIQYKMSRDAIASKQQQGL
jgi:hypothetical protein